jgi:type II secretory pathway component PulF
MPLPFSVSSALSVVNNLLSFRYRASTSEGQVVEGVVQAPSHRSALEEVRRLRLVPVELTPDADTRRASRRSSLGKAPALALFARTIATLLSAGVTLERALAFAAEQARHADVAAAARQVHQGLQGGASLAEALAQHPRVFGSLFVAMVSAGEESGALDESMARLADHLDEGVELRAQIRSSLLYPALMAIVTGVGITVLLLFVVPRFAALFGEEGAALPLSTRLLVGTSEVVAGGWLWLILIGVVLVFGGRSWLARPENRRRWHARRLGWPLIGDLEAKYATARFARALGMLLRGGRPVLPSLRAARAAVSNVALGEGLDRAAEAVSHGKRVHVALTGTLPALATELIAVGEESGRLDELCLRVADSYDNEVRRALRTFVAVIEPAMILLFGLIVGFVALAMLQAIYGLNRSAL